VAATCRFPLRPADGLARRTGEEVCAESQGAAKQTTPPTIAPRPLSPSLGLALQGPAAVTLRRRSPNARELLQVVEVLLERPQHAIQGVFPMAIMAIECRIGDGKEWHFVPCYSGGRAPLSLGGFAMMSNDKLTVRRAGPADVPGLVELNHQAYPDLILDNVVYNEPQLQAHLERFPAGQLVAEKAGQLAGAISTLIPDRRIDVLGPHTWEGITDGGYFTRHDPGGRSLYLADIYVAPQFQGQRVGAALYRALIEICKELKLTNVVAGGRLWGYSEVADQMSAQQYVAEVVAGRMHDRVLTSQLRAGFVVRGVLGGYLHDWRSRHWATLLEWTNPEMTVSSSVRLGPMIRALPER